VLNSGFAKGYLRARWGGGDGEAEMESQKQVGEKIRKRKSWKPGNTWREGVK
jgi:hypothetical protein